MADLNYQLRLVTGPAAEPITAAQVRTWCKLSSSAGEHSDTELERCITSARQILEAQCDIRLITQTWAIYLDEFPAWEICLPKGPWLSITTVKYYNSSGTFTTIASTEYLFDSYGGRLTPDTDTSWPSPQARINAVEVTFVSGYGSSATDVPAIARECLLEIVADRLKNKGGMYQIASGTREKMMSLWSGRL